MNEAERKQLQQYVEDWRVLGPILEKMRHAKVEATDTPAALQRLEDAFASALFLHQPTTTSGLVQQQALFAKARR